MPLEDELVAAWRSLLSANGEEEIEPALRRLTPLIEGRLGSLHRRRLAPLEIPSSVAFDALSRLGDRWPVAPLLSMHPDGWVRLAAVDLLAKREDGRALRYLMLRTGDWVPQVVAPAESAALRAVKRATDREIVAAVPYVRRAFNAWSVLVSAFLDRIQEPSALALATRLTGADARWLAHRISGDWRRRSMDERVRLDLYREGLSPDQAREMLRDRSPRVRELAAEALPQDDPALREALIDRSQRVRTTARLRLPNFDFTEFFATRLEVPTAILGWAESRSPGALQAARTLMRASGGRGRAAAIEALAFLDDRPSTSEIATYLADPSPGVARAARLALVRMNATLDAGNLEEIARAPLPLNVRSNALRALQLVSRWDRLIVLLRNIGDPELADLSAQMLRAWLSLAPMRVDPPGEARGSRAAEALNVTQPWLDGELHRGILEEVRRWT